MKRCALKRLFIGRCCFWGFFHIAQFVVYRAYITQFSYGCFVIEIDNTFIRLYRI